MANLKNIIIDGDTYNGVKQISVQDADASNRDLFLSESFIENTTNAVAIGKNGTQTLGPTSGFEATKKIIVEVDVKPNLEQKTVDIATNSTTEVTPTTGKDGMSKVIVNVNVPSSGGVEEVATAAAMNALLVEANVGKYYKFTGPTDSNYTNGNLYLVESV